MRFFITVGTQKFQFNRLIQSVDEYAEEHPKDSFVAQTGYCTYEPKHIEWTPFIDKEQFDELMDNADIVITHGGTGAIVGALRRGKRVIAIPRNSKYGEHVDNHQFQITETFSKTGYIVECIDLTELDASIEEIIKMNPIPFKSNTEVFLQSINHSIEEFAQEQRISGKQKKSN